MRFLADLGNTRLKLARAGHAGAFEGTHAWPIEDRETWEPAIAELGGFAHGARWSVASVRPASAELLARLLARHGVESISWFRSALDVPVENRLERPGETGADRALAVLGSFAIEQAPVARLVVQCGTAITVEAVDETGTWLGGAIAPGWRPLAESLHRHAAQLPLVERPSDARFPSSGNQTHTAMTAGIGNMIVGGCRELLNRLRTELGSTPTVFWTGGDAEWLAPLLEGRSARVEPELVLHGLAAAVRGTDHPA